MRTLNIQEVACVSGSFQNVVNWISENHFTNTVYGAGFGIALTAAPIAIGTIIAATAYEEAFIEIILLAGCGVAGSALIGALVGTVITWQGL